MVFQRADAPVAPGSKGMSLFVHGISDEARQTYRDRLFAVDRYAYALGSGEARRAS
jgi:hypothetical protein